MIDVQAVRDWLEKHEIRACSACGHGELQVSKDLYALLCVHPRTGGPDLQRGSRLVRLRCERCGHVMLFHARQMGLE